MERMPSRVLIKFYDGPLKGSKIECDYFITLDMPVFVAGGKTSCVTYMDTRLRILTMGKDEIYIYKLAS